MKWAVPVDDHRTRWLTVDFYPFEDGEPTDEAMRAMRQTFNIGYAENLPLDWAQQVGAWWNLGHPARQGPIWEDEAIMSTQGSDERGRFPDWDKWRLATSDRGVLFMHELWEEQVERIQEGLDPVGIIRGPEAEQIIPIPGENLHIPWDEGKRLWDMPLQERIERRIKEIEHK